MKSMWIKEADLSFTGGKKVKHVKIGDRVVYSGNPIQELIRGGKGDAPSKGTLGTVTGFVDPDEKLAWVEWDDNNSGSYYVSWLRKADLS